MTPGFQSLIKKSANFPKKIKFRRSRLSIEFGNSISSTEKSSTVVAISRNLDFLRKIILTKKLKVAIKNRWTHKQRNITGELERGRKKRRWGEWWDRGMQIMNGNSEKGRGALQGRRSPSLLFLPLSIDRSLCYIRLRPPMSIDYS